MIEPGNSVILVSALLILIIWYINVKSRAVINIKFEPTILAGDTSRDINLVVRKEHYPEKQSEGPLNIGDIFDRNGELIDKIVTVRSPSAMIHDALSKELEILKFNPLKIVAAQDMIDHWMNHTEEVPYHNTVQIDNTRAPTPVIYIVGQDIVVEQELHWLSWKIKARVSFCVQWDMTSPQFQFEATDQGFAVVTTATATERVLRSALRASASQAALMLLADLQEQQSLCLDSIYS